MSPQVTAAVVAASVSLLTLIGTLAAQYFGRRATSRDLKEQGERLDRTLDEQRTRTLNERFATAAGQLGSDKPPAVRLAGVYAMAGLADDWPENRQTCVDVLCAYLRLPYEPDPGQDARGPERLAFRASGEVRRTVIRVITAHLQDGAKPSWQGLNLDFTGAVFDGGDFDRAGFSGGTVSFTGAEFSGEVGFNGAEFSGGTVSFDGAEFTGEVDFNGAEFAGGTVSFDGAEFTGEVDFNGTEFAGGTVSFDGAEFTGEVDFGSAEFSGGEINFRGAGFSGGEVRFSFARFSGGEVRFSFARFSGGEVRFNDANFPGGELDFRRPGDWSCPPAFPWTGTPPPGVVLPENEDQSQT